jgi:hypothetical protein
MSYKNNMHGIFWKRIFSGYQVYEYLGAQLLGGNQYAPSHASLSSVTHKTRRSFIEHSLTTATAATIGALSAEGTWKRNHLPYLDFA